MEAYRDQYATLFNAGKQVTVIALSVDADTTLASWARELGTPVLFGSDSEQRVAKLYSAAVPNRPVNARHVYVIGRDGRIAHKMVPFRELVAAAYTELEGAVKKASAGPASPGDGK